MCNLLQGAAELQLSRAMVNYLFEDGEDDDFEYDNDVDHED